MSLVQVLIQILRKQGMIEGYSGMTEALKGHNLEAEKHEYALQVLSKVFEEFENVLSTIEEK